VVYEAHYLFRDRASFRRYETESAPALRAEGMARFPPDRGVTYVRSTGDVVGAAHEVKLAAGQAR
jgi:hypothetical protein